MMIRVWEVVKVLFLVAVVLALFYAYAHGGEFALPNELAFLGNAEIVAAFSCVKRETGEKAVCVILATEESEFLLAIDPDTKQVREAYRQDGEKIRQIYWAKLKPT